MKVKEARGPEFRPWMGRISSQPAPMSRRGLSSPREAEEEVRTSLPRGKRIRAGQLGWGDKTTPKILRSEWGFPDPGTGWVQESNP